MTVTQTVLQRTGLCTNICTHPALLQAQTFLTSSQFLLWDLHLVYISPAYRFETDSEGRVTQEDAVLLEGWDDPAAIG